MCQRRDGDEMVFHRLQHFAQQYQRMLGHIVFVAIFNIIELILRVLGHGCLLTIIRSSS